MEISQIGIVKKDEKGTYIQLEQNYVSGLLNIEGFSYLLITWWAHLYDNKENRKVLKINKPYVNGPEEIGVFATRSPVRPNPICVSPIPVQELDIVNGKIYTYYIDAEIDTPILDIKPYYPCSDKVESASTPSWCSHWPKSYEESGSFAWENEFNF